MAERLEDEAAEGGGETTLVRLTRAQYESVASVVEVAGCFAPVGSPLQRAAKGPFSPALHAGAGARVRANQGALPRQDGAVDRACLLRTA